MPDLFHTASIWLTLTLGVQRYICVCHPLKAKIWCTMKKTLRWIGTIFLMAFVSHLYLVLRLKEVPVDRPSAVDANKNVTGCYWETFVKDVDTLRPLKEAYTWYHAILINIIPCVTLLVMNVLLIRAMRQAEKRRVELSCQSRRRESRRLKESTSTTLMLVIVVSLFLLVEIPNGVYYICSSISATYNLAWYVIDVVVIFLNILVFLNNPFIFVVYCTMSKKFRNSLKQLFTSSSATEHQNDVTSAANRRTGVTS
nr:hypothetical protein BaRGS_015650 [Batillaria attramentaria]